ncbi:MAG: CARDB domain-containing protein [Xanthomarina gelatinilytica]|uniref:CARDB domain-containing protein n=1 Tax=Xanthomarina gelatinilytica TaxID=1137281 RepID=UPI003A8C84AF
MGSHTYPNAYDFDTSNQIDELVLNSSDGIVTFIDNSNSTTGYGNFVRITHANEHVTLYAHLFEIFVEEGDEISQGCAIGFEGNTGASSGDHIHFEYEAPNSAYNVEPIFEECNCVPHSGYYYTSSNTESPCISCDYSNNVVTSCSNDFEPNNSQNQAFTISSIGKDFSTHYNFGACLSYNNVFEDWYLIGVTAQGELNVTLTNQTDNFGIELYYEGSNNPFDTGILQSNCNLKINWCSPSNACIPLYIRVFQEQFSTQQTNPNYNYNLVLDWNYNQSCNTSGKQYSSDSNQNSNLIITGNTNVCVGEATTLVVSGGTGAYQWFLNGSEIGTGNSVTINNLNIGNNSVNVVDLDSACSTGSISINAIQEVTANAGSNVTIQNGGSTTLQGSGGSSCSWSPTTGLSNPNSCTTTASPTQTTTYTLTVTENGCTDTDTVTVTVDGSGGGEPPINDDCSDAITLTSSTSCSYTTGTVEDATPSFGANLCGGCSCTSPDDYDVYYKFTAVETSHTVTVSNYASNFDVVIELRTACSSGSSNYISCFDPIGAPSSVSETWNGLTIGQTYYIRVFEWGYQQSPPNSNTFDICVTHQNINSDGTDLVSNITSVSDDNPDAEDTITVNYTVSNNGDTDTQYWITTSFYLSTNTTLSGSDDYLGSDAINQTIGSNETVNASVSVTLPNVSDGQYYLFVNPDPANIITESNEDNNLDFYSIQIGDVIPNGPDLDVRDIDVVPDANLIPGQEVDIEIRIENEGTEDVNDFEVLVFLDIDGDNDYDTNEYMGEFTFNGLDAGEDDTMTVDFDLPINISSTGTYELFAIADSDNAINEPNENNNDDDENVTIGYVYSGTNDDVIVLNQTVSPTNVSAGDDVLATANHVYLGSQLDTNIPTLDLGYYLSTDCVLSIDDILLDDDTSGLGSDDPIHEEDQTLTIPLGTLSGTYFILFVADMDNEIVEGVLENNNVECVEITVTNTNSPEGDIYITDQACMPYNVMVGNNVETFVNVHYSGNQLDEDLPSFTLSYYLSTDCTLSIDDTFLDDTNTHLGFDNPTLNDVENNPLPPNLSPGIYYIIFVVDAENELYEINEENNIACAEFEVLLSNPNHQDVTLTSPYVNVSEASTGDPIYVSVFQNYTGYQTDDDLDSVRVQYYLSTDCVLSSDDYYLEDDLSSIGSDDPSQFEEQTIIIPNDIDAGDYYILFVADGENIVDETNEDNNLECIQLDIIEGSLSIGGSEVENQIKIYPNPVSDILTIDLARHYMTGNVEIYNVIGQKVVTYQINNQQIIKISTKSFSNGMYFLKIKTENNNTKEFKLIKKD